jgi:hypothetical protein
VRGGRTRDDRTASLDPMKRAGHAAPHPSGAIAMMNALGGPGSPIYFEIDPDHAVDIEVSFPRSRQPRGKTRGW